VGKVELVEQMFVFVVTIVDAERINITGNPITFSLKL